MYTCSNYTLTLLFFIYAQGKVAVPTKFLPELYLFVCDCILTILFCLTEGRSGLINDALKEYKQKSKRQFSDREFSYARAVCCLGCISIIKVCSKLSLYDKDTILTTVNFPACVWRCTYLGARVCCTYMLM